jgi:seryl-tRNA synthetase
MLDIDILRKNPEIIRESLKERGAEDVMDTLIEKDKNKRAFITKHQELLRDKKQLSSLIGELIKYKDKSLNSLKEKAELTDKEITKFQRESFKKQEEFNNLWHSIPNIPLPEVPYGKNEEDNHEIKRWGTPREDHVLPHDFAWDQSGAVSMSGSRFVMLSGMLARLERALGQFMLDVHTKEHDYTEVSVPYLVKDHALFGTGQLPKFEDDLFKTCTGHYLIPTGEVPLTNMVANCVMEEQSFPYRYTALTPCFRREAGSAGRDTSGLIRLHQFNKVELVSITSPEQAEEEHERMTRCAEVILERLGLPYRRMLLCTGDMGFAAEKTYDLEVWMPSQQTYREISSCSRFGTFQARRMKAQYRRKYDGEIHFAHTLNGSGLAVGRTLAAIIENYRTPKQNFEIPDALAKYM